MMASCDVSFTARPVTIESVCEAIAQLYAPTTSAVSSQSSDNTVAVRNAASRWLALVKQSPLAWQLIWQLLESERLDMERFLGATFLRDKMRERWSEVPQTELHALRSRLLALTLDSYALPSSACAPLVEALAVLLVQTCCDIWPEAINELTAACQSLSDQLTGAKLLLAVLAETPLQLSKCHISSEKRAAVKAKLSACTGQVLQLVTSLLGECVSESVSSRCIELISGWLVLDITAEPLLPLIDLVLVPFTDSPALIGVTLDMMERVVSSAANHHLSITVMTLARQTLTLQPFIDKFIDQQQPEALVLVGSVFTSLVSTHSRTLLNALCPPSSTSSTSTSSSSDAELVGQLVGAVLQLTSTPGRYPSDETVSELTFGVWYTLQDDILACEGEQRARLISHLQPVYLKLVNVLLHKSMLSASDHTDDQDDEDREAFRKYRQDIVDFYTYTQSLLSHYILDSFIVYLHGAIQAVRQDCDRWPALEAVLHGLAGLGEHCSVDECDEQEIRAANSMRTVLLTLPDIPYRNNTHLMLAALKLIDACSSTFELHPSCLQCLVPMLLAGLDHNNNINNINNNNNSRPRARAKTVSLYATMALKDICQEAPAAVASHASSILPACKSALLSGRLSDRECMRLMYVVGSLVLHISPPEARADWLNQLLLPAVGSFEQLLAAEQLDASVYNRLAAQVHSFSALPSAMSLSAAASVTTDNNDNNNDDDASSHTAADVVVAPLVLDLLRVLLPPLSRLACQRGKHENVAESVCSFIHHSVSAVGEYIHPLLEHCLRILSELYSQEPHFQVLDICKQLVLFDPAMPCGTVVTSWLPLLCSVSAGHFGNDPSQHPEAVAHFLDLWAHVIRKQHQYAVISAAQLPEIIQLACRCMCLCDRRVMRSSCSFLCQLAECSCQLQLARQLLISHGPMIVSSLLSAIVSECPRDCVDFAADVLTVLSRVCIDQLSSWMTQLILAPPTSQAGPSSSPITAAPSPLATTTNPPLEEQQILCGRATAQQKRIFVKNVLNCRNSRTFVRAQVGVFFRQCRGLNDT